MIAGFGDTGLLVAIHLGTDFNIVGISPKPCLVSGQELGMRLTQPEAWKQDYLMPFSRYKKLRRVRTLPGLIAAINPEINAVTVQSYRMASNAIALPRNPLYSQADKTISTPTLRCGQSVK